jgi:hypothetical protein
MKNPWEGYCPKEAIENCADNFLEFLEGFKYLGMALAYLLLVVISPVLFPILRSDYVTRKAEAEAKKAREESIDRIFRGRSKAVHEDEARE